MTDAESSQKPYDIDISIIDPHSGGYTIENVVSHRFNTYGPEGAKYHKIEATTAGGLEHVVIVSAERFISLSTDPGDDSPAPAPLSTTVYLNRPDDETIELVTPLASATFTHDEHGWVGMSAAITAAKMVAAAMGGEVVGE